MANIYLMCVFVCLNSNLVCDPESCLSPCEALMTAQQQHFAHTSGTWRLITCHVSATIIKACFPVCVNVCSAWPGPLLMKAGSLPLWTVLLRWSGKKGKETASNYL